jgi:hypothetical protein
VKRTRFQDYLIEVSQNPQDGYRAVISRRDGKHTLHGGTGKFVVATQSFATADAALAEAFRLIKGGDVA